MSQNMSLSLSLEVKAFEKGLEEREDCKMSKPGSSRVIQGENQRETRKGTSPVGKKSWGSLQVFACGTEREIGVGTVGTTNPTDVLCD